MTASNRVAIEIAQRVIEAAETASVSSLNQELGAAEQLLTNDEERLELLAAIAHDMRAALDASSSNPLQLREDFQPHLQLLRHLTIVKQWVN